MNKRSMGLLLLPVIVLFGGVPAAACSNGYFSADRKAVIGRTMDWHSSQGQVVVNPRGVARKAVGVPSAEAAEWNTVYGYLSFNLVNKVSGLGDVSSPGGGINEKGLYVASLWAPATLYSSPSEDSKKAISVGEVVAFCLAQFATVDEAVSGLRGVQVRAFDMGKFDVNLHWFIADASGKTAYLEFVDRKLAVHPDPKVPVMTNMTYADERAALNNYEGFGGSRQFPEAVDKSGISTQERFILLSRDVMNARDGRRPVSVDSVFEAMSGVCRAPAKNSGQRAYESATEWIEVYDIASRTVYWRSMLVPGVKSVHLDELDFSRSGMKSFMDVHVAGNGDMKNAFTLVY